MKNHQIKTMINSQLINKVAKKSDNPDKLQSLDSAYLMKVLAQHEVQIPKYNYTNGYQQHFNLDSYLKFRSNRGDFDNWTVDTFVRKISGTMLHYGFRHVDCTVYELAKSVWRGHSFSSWVNGWRKKDNFVCRQDVSLDFDTGCHLSSMEYLKTTKLYQYSAFMYSTPSSTKENPKTRLVFILPKPLKCGEWYETLYRGIRSEYPQADNTADCNRIFYGSKGCELVGNWELFPVRLVTFYHNYQKGIEENKIEKSKESVITSNEQFPIHIYCKGIYRTVAKASEGNRHYALRNMGFIMGGYVREGYYSHQTAANYLLNACREWGNINEDYESRQIDRFILAGIEKCTKVKPFYSNYQQGTLMNVPATKTQTTYDTTR